MQFTGSQAREGAATHRRIATEVQRFRDGSDSWFDGTVRSTDKRLAACTRVLHLARSAVARSPFDWSHHEIIAELEADHRALVGQREDLFSGYADRVAFTPPDPPQHINEDLKAAWREDVANGINPTERHLPEKYRTAAQPNVGILPNPLQGFDPGAQSSPRPSRTNNEMSRDWRRNPVHAPPLQGPSEWDEGASDWSTQGIKDPNVGNPLPSDPVSYSPPGFAEMKARGAYGSLDADEERWAALEGAKFARANADVAHFTDELATRARYYAQKVASGFSHPNESTHAFVRAVLKAAYELPKPSPVTRVASRNVLDLPPEAMFL